jgi:DtxR family Mn-dependent transcriptional regulator
MVAVLPFAIALAMVVLGGLLVWGRRAIVRVWRGRVALERIAIEDALKHIHAQEVRGHLATRESVAGGLGMPLAEAMQHLVTMEERGLIRHADSGLALTDDGRALALQVIRAHRLLERYFADELRMPLQAVHPAADRREHGLTPAGATMLDAHLGYPRRDPHGDPIPTATGTVAALEGTPLHQWPIGVPADIVHLEDEPADVFRDMTTAGLKVGLTIEILDRTDQGIVVWDGEREYVVPARATDNVFVNAARRPRVPSVRLSDLRPGESATVRDLECEGFGRRRLMDLGMTPGTRIDCLFVGLAPEPMAYRVRGAVIALRREQAAEIVIDRADRRLIETAPAVPAEAPS